MRSSPRPGRRGALLAAVAAIAASAARPAAADVITIGRADAGKPGVSDIPFTCSVGTDNGLWLPTMGFVYRNVEPFELAPGDTIAFDIEMRATDPDDLGFHPQVDIALAHASDPQLPFKPDDLPGSDFTTVVHGGIAASQGNRTRDDYDLVFTADAPFRFPGGGLIIRIQSPQGELATRTDAQCLPVISADEAPTGANRLVGTFKLEAGEYPWAVENTSVFPNVPFVRISWTRCGDGRVSGAEQCDDGNADDTDGCTSACLIPPPVCGDGIVQAPEQCDDGNLDDTDDCTSLCLAPACGDGIVQVSEQCDNSADPEHPDPFCDDGCHIAAYAKGSGCSTGGGAGLVAALLVLVLVRRRRSAVLAIVIGTLWSGSAHAQRKTDGFRVDRFEMAPSVEDGLVVQDPGVLRHMSWSVSAALGFTDTLLRVVPRLDSDQGIDVVGTRLSAYLDFAIGLGDRFEVNAALPFAVAQASQSGTAAGFMLKSAGASAVGDARVGGSVLLYGHELGPQAGLAAAVAIPVGSESSFTSDGKLGAELLATAGYVAPGYRVAVNGGVRFRPETDYVSSDQGTELVGRAGVFVPVVDRRLVTSLELDLIARAAGRDAYKALGSPILPMLGARYHFAGGIRAGAGVGMGLTEAPGSPSVRVLVTIGYEPEPRPARPAPPRLVDSDGDGIADRDDACPTQPEDFDGFQDDDGCPDIEDDHDKITDSPPDPSQPLTLEQVVTLPAPIEFKFDTAIMLPGAEVYLNQVLEILKKHPEVQRLEIQGHTSSEGGAEYNLRLSNDRARAVFTWLVDRGIDAQRLTPRGYGLTRPLFPNDTEPHRQRNRRVQFRLLEQAPGTAPLGSRFTARPPPGALPQTEPPPASAPPPPATTPPASAPPPPATTPPATAPSPAPSPPATTPPATAPSPQAAPPRPR
ncbi:MAG TPA: OmpA family protein [Kofleriaceae bacterium]|nr:OmpA family protein [Kofleriaceae bacterium]